VEYSMRFGRFRLALGITTALLAGLALVAAVPLAVKNERMRVVLDTRFRDGMNLSRLLPHRLDTWQCTADAFRSSPVKGSGLGSFPTVFTQHAIAVYTKYAHNLILQAAVDTGVIGASLLVVFLGYVVLRSAWLILPFNNKQDAAVLPLTRAFAVASLVFIAYNMFDWEWYVPALTAWFMLGVACTETNGASESLAARDPDARPR